MKIIKNYFLLIIIVIAIFFRFFQLGSNPPSLTWDEASWGYNAYSIGIDGKDEFGRLLPHDYLESFGDFKPPMYAYLDVIPVKLFGLNEFSTRFPSAFFGVLSVLLTFLLVKRIFPNSKNKEKYALFSALFLAISPWHILLSRAAFEANVATFFIITGVWSFLAGVQDKKLYLLISASSFAFSMYTFNTARIVSPLIVLILVIAFRKSLLKIKKQAIVSVVLGAILFLPTFGFLLSPQAGLRFKEVNIFSDPEVVELANQEIKNDNNALYSKVFHNRRLIYAVSYVKHYFDNLSLLFLFTKGDGNPKFSLQDMGQMYIWDIVFFVGGIFLVFRRREGNWWLIPVWLLVGIIPAATARETPHALRIETALPTFQIFVAFGFVQIIEMIKNYKKVILYCLMALLAFNVLYFYHDYFYNYKYDYSGEWQYGYKESIDFVYKNQDKFKNIYITQSLGRPYIYYLFYGKVFPSYFRENSIVKRDAFGFVDVQKVGRYNFVSNSATPNLIKKNSLYITDRYNIPTNAKILKTFYLLNGDQSLIAYTYD